jgi:D-alanyl-D-alanine carboxypeptidase
VFVVYNPLVPTRALPIILAALCALHAQRPSPAASAAAEPDTMRLAAVLDSLRAHKRIPGVSVCLILPDGGTWHGTSGEAWSATPVTSATLFEIGSITKTFTAALVMSLVSEDRLSLDDSLRHWLPEFPHAAGVTVRHLLQHTSGLYNYAENPDYIPALRADFSRVWKPADSFAFMKDPYFAPGRGWHYSNANYLLLGLIAENVTKGQFSVELRRRLLVPRQLHSTFFRPDESPDGVMAHAFVDINNDGNAEDLSALVGMTSFITAAWSAGALVATAPDLARWMRAYATGDVSGKELYPEMTRWIDRGDGMQYGFGLIRKPDDRLGTLLGHKGNTAGFSATAWHAVDRGMTIAVLTNLNGIDVTPIALALVTTALHPRAGSTPRR